MERTLTKDTVEQIGKKVKLAGWINTIRDHGKITFIDLRDRSGFVQCVGKGLPKVSQESVVEVNGLVKKRPEKLVNPKIETGAVEVEIEKLEVISKAHELPFDMGTEELELELPTLLDYRSLTLRHPKIKAIFKVQEVVIDAFRRALQLKEFVEFQAPLIISSAPEGGAEIFKVKYFDYTTYLAQSPQLYKSLLVSIFERVFSVNKVFRAEPSVTTRHLTEVISLDAEFGFIEDYIEVKEMAEFVIKFILKEVEEKCKEELAMYKANIPTVTDSIPIIKLREAQQIIFERTGRDVRAEKDLAPEDEREICLWSKEVHGSDLVFVSHYPTKARPFYTYPDPEDPEYNQGFDLIGRGTEWMTGGRRIHDYETLLEHVRDWGIGPENIELYLQAYRYGMPPLGGFAFGAERITMHILGLKNIREASIFPRDMERVDIRLSTLETKDKEPKSGKKDIYAEVVESLSSKSISFEKFEHEPVYTSEDAAKVRGTDIHQGAKALVLQAGKNFILYVLPADLQADLEILAEKLKVKKLRMASKESVKAKTGLEVGAIPPLGSIVGLKTYVDSRLAGNEQIAFNAGRHDRSIKMEYKDFVKVERPEIISLS
jgi:nondiscriminating aspartyl-tRNA synthetase